LLALLETAVGSWLQQMLTYALRIKTVLMASTGSA